MGLTPHESPTASDLLARRPKYNLGGEALWLDTRLHWDSKAKRELRILAGAGVSIERVADLLGRSPTSIAHRCRSDRLQMPAAWAKVIRTARRTSPRWTPLAYPYVNFRRAEANTLLIVNEMVSRALPGREDVCQDIMLAILERGLTPNKVTVNEFIRKFRRDNYESGGFALSLDAPMPGTDDFRLIDTLSQEDSIWERI
jgi:hypothetical protein